MNRKAVSGIMLTLLLIGMLTLSFNIQQVKAEPDSSYIPVPYHHQVEYYYCGPASLEMVFDFYGPDISQLGIADVARTSYVYGGTFTDDMRRAVHFSNLSTSVGVEMPGSVTGYSARKLGYASFEPWGFTLEELKSLIDAGYPIIVLTWFTEAKTYGHYRVVVGYNETHMTLQDPWFGPMLNMTIAKFLDFWEYSGYWGLFVSPWNVNVSVPESVREGDTFVVSANVTYPCPPPFSMYDYPASFSNATIKLPVGLSLDPTETPTRVINMGSLTAGSSTMVNWTVKADSPGNYTISVEAEGKVTGSVSTHNPYPGYSYEDRIGGSGKVDVAVKQAPVPPIASFSYFPDFPTINDTVTFNASDSYDPNGYIVGYEWNFGDGNITKVTGPILTHAYAEAANYAVTLNVTDNQGLWDETTKIIQILEVMHDVAVTNVNPHRNVIGQNYTVNINCTVENKGDVTETFNLTLYYNSSIIETQSLTLNNSDSRTLIFTWDTTGVAKGNYTITAEATPVRGETDRTDNTLTDGWVVVTIPGDVDGDFKVSYKDLFLLAAAYCSRPGDPNWNPNCDIDGDNRVSHKDLFILAANYGKT